MWFMSIFTKQYSSAWLSRLHLYRFGGKIRTNCPELTHRTEFFQVFYWLPASPWDQSRATSLSRAQKTRRWVLSNAYCAINTVWWCELSHWWPSIKAKTKTWPSSAEYKFSVLQTQPKSCQLFSSKVIHISVNDWHRQLPSICKMLLWLSSAEFELSALKLL